MSVACSVAACPEAMERPLNSSLSVREVGLVWLTWGLRWVGRAHHAWKRWLVSTWNAGWWKREVGPGGELAQDAAPLGSSGAPTPWRGPPECQSQWQAQAAVIWGKVPAKCLGTRGPAGRGPPTRSGSAPQAGQGLPAREAASQEMAEPRGAGDGQCQGQSGRAWMVLASWGA